jgi:hypothetical protein
MAMVVTPTPADLAREAADRALAHALGWWSSLPRLQMQDALLDARSVAIALAECAIRLLPPSAAPERRLDAGEEAAGAVYGYLLTAREVLGA